MSTKRLLFIHDDPELGDIYRDCLELAGFTVETARTGATGLRLAEELHPDAVVVDPILESDDITASVAQLRAKYPAPNLPILVLPTTNIPLSNSLLKAGATQAIEKSGDLLSSIIAEVSSALGLDKERSGSTNSAFDIGQWRYAALTAASESLTTMRQTLREIMRDPVPGPLWRKLLQQTHTFVGQVSLVGENAVAHLAASVEVLVYGLENYPDRINPLTLRTLGQAVDFLATLWEQGAHLKPIDLQSSQILIVEDDSRTRELIAASMQLVGLNADGMETPGASLAVLSTQPFDLIFMDVNLPEMNGFEACTKIRELSLNQHTPVIFLTGMTSFQNRVQSSLSGGSDFVGKPFNVAELGVKALIWLFKGRLGLN